MTVEKIGASKWVARSTYEEKDVVKAAGFRWDPVMKYWWTNSEAVALRLADPEKAAAVLAEKRAETAAAVAASRAGDAEIEIPVPDGLSYLPFQRAGIAYALARKNTLFGDEMGLGKTIQAIGVLNADSSAKRVLVVCPASLKLNWKRELTRWLVRPARIVIASGDCCPVDPAVVDILILNYDIADRHRVALASVVWDVLILDEAHYMKNPAAKRTKAILGSQKGKGKEAVPGIQAHRKLILTGTPIPNRPIEGHTIFSAAAPEVFGSFWGYAKRYCNATRGSYGWDLSGASNLGELQEKLRASCMVRRLKMDVLTELPAKRRQVIDVEANGASGAVERENAAMAAHEEKLASLRVAVELAKAESDEVYREAVAALAECARVAFTEMSKVRHETAVAKVPKVVAFLQDLIEGGKKVICFAHHKDVIDAIMEEFPGAVKVTGDVSMVERQAAVDRFQADPACTLFVGNIQAAGVGLTLTASDTVVFAELDWVPGNVTQAEDRAHRIGQKNMVMVYHLVLDGSLDSKMARTLIQKQEVADLALDREIEREAVTPMKDRAATETATRKAIADVAAGMTPERIAAIHEGLRILAGYDADHARELNGMGYSKLDVRIGHSLAETCGLSPKQAALGAKLVNKYRRQLPADLVERARG